MRGTILQSFYDRFDLENRRSYKFGLYFLHLTGLLLMQSVSNLFCGSKQLYEYPIIQFLPYPKCSWLIVTSYLQVKNLHQENKLSMMVDKDLKNNYDRVELEEMVQVALLCTQYHPSHRPKMSEVVRMLEGDGLAEKWEASQKIDTPKSRSSEQSQPPPKYMDFVEDSSLVVEAIELSGPR